MNDDYDDDDDYDQVDYYHCVGGEVTCGERRCKISNTADVVNKKVN